VTRAGTGWRQLKAHPRPERYGNTHGLREAPRFPQLVMFCWPTCYDRVGVGAIEAIDRPIRVLWQMAVGRKSGISVPISCELQMEFIITHNPVGGVAESTADANGFDCGHASPHQWFCIFSTSVSDGHAGTLGGRKSPPSSRSVDLPGADIASHLHTLVAAAIIKIAVVRSEAQTWLPTM
jgi:hypothetical protein